MFKGRSLIIATKHKKEEVIAPIAEKALGVKCIVSEALDTDRLGTFTGEVERTDDPITTARKKCLLAMELCDVDLAIASEGSFGAHPSLFFVPADEELLLFMDKKNNIELIARDLSVETNFASEEINEKIQLEEFAARAKFPSHGLILRKSREETIDIVKGITDWNLLNSSFVYLLSRYGSAYVETDMRAMFNPTRMGVIDSAARKLIEKINSVCPNCNFPGYDVTEVKHGLPCKLCGFPTRSTLSHIYSCKKCLYTEEIEYPTNKFAEDPMYCDRCNP